jgi:LysM repeat protein
MDFLELLKFAPLILGLAFIAFLLFRKDPFSSFNLGKLITYFIGVIITFFVVGWLVDSFVFSWANDRLENADSSLEFQEFKDRSERIIDNTFSEETNTTVSQPRPTVVITNAIEVTATPSSDPVLRPESGPRQYTVVSGDTLFGIAQRYHTTVNDIMVVNGLTSHTIMPGQVLNIPAPSK